MPFWTKYIGCVIMRIHALHNLVRPPLLRTVSLPFYSPTLPCLVPSPRSKHGAESLRKYKYAGADLSYTFRYVFNPFYNRVIEYVPAFVAPNLITLTGFMFPLVSHFLMAQYAPNLEGYAPTWLYYFNAAALIIYMWLDALDGKQARRTGSSSPLGLLFDHGCDALNSCVSCMTLCSALQLGGSWKSVLLMMATSSIFYAATWEEYYTGELILPVINGANEGVILTAIFHVITAVMGPAFWTQTNSFGVLNSSVLLGFIFATCVPTLGMNFFNVVRRAMKTGGPSAVAVAVARWIPIVLVFSFFGGWALYSPSNIFLAHPRLFMWAITFVFCKMVTSLMLAHLCDEGSSATRGREGGVWLYCVAWAASLRAQPLTHSTFPSRASSLFPFLSLPPPPYRVPPVRKDGRDLPIPRVPRALLPLYGQARARG